MTPKGLFSNGTFNKLSIATLVIGIACALSTAYLMTKLDTLIHVQLYNFGLQFDHAWAEPYWTYAYTMYTALALPIILSLLALAAAAKLKFTSKATEGKAAGANRIFHVALILAMLFYIICLLIGIYLMTKLDTLIHVQLYNFGLQFDHAWAEPYWTYAYTMYTALALPIILSLLIMPTGIALLLSKPQGTPLINTKTTVSTHESRETNQGKKEPAQSQRQPIINQENKPAPLQSPAQQAQAANQESQPKKSQSTGTANISCSNCGRKLGRALLMLSFENGKSKLVKVCPYCNHTLGDALNEQQKLQLGSSGR